MSNIQNKILAKILTNVELKFTQARPNGIENDLYNYHLQHLIKKKVVEKMANKYRLTEFGKHFVNFLNPLDPKGNLVDKFKINCLTVVTKIVGNKIFVLNQERLRHPFFGHIGVMGGPIKSGEKILDAASRNLKIETGLKGQFKVLGTVHKVCKNKKGQILSDVMFVICICHDSAEALKNKTVFGRNFWINIDQAIENESTWTAPTKKLVQILKQIKLNKIDKAVFFEEEFQIINTY